MAGRLQRRDWREPGGIRGLVKLIDEHRGAFEFDWRNKFHTALGTVGHDMAWGEAYRLTALLITDPSSQVCAAMRGWVYPSSREDMVLRDIFDLQHQSKAKRKPDPYPRPWHRQPKSYGTGTSMTAADFARIKAEIAERN